MAQRTAVILNRRSGRALSEGQLGQALQASAVDADVLPLQTKIDASAWSERVADSYDVLVAAGGDGTVSAVAAAAARTGKTLGVIPMGTLNHFARDAGIPVQLGGAIAVLAAGYIRRIDVAVVNDLIFVNNASIGAYPRLVWERNRARHRGWPPPLAGAVALLRTWMDLCSITVHLRIDFTERVRRTPFVLVGNGEYEVEGTQFGRRPSVADGKLSLYMTPDSGRFGVLALPVRALLRTLKLHDKFETYTAASIAISTAGPRIELALDGEVRSLEPPLRFSIRPNALCVLVPPGQV